MPKPSPRAPVSLTLGELAEALGGDPESLYLSLQEGVALGFVALARDRDAVRVTLVATVVARLGLEHDGERWFVDVDAAERAMEADEIKAIERTAREATEQSALASAASGPTPVPGLDDRHRRFVDAFCGPANGDVTEAARLAGFAYPVVEGPRAMKKARVREEVERRTRPETSVSSSVVRELGVKILEIPRGFPKNDG